MINMKLWEQFFKKNKKWEITNDIISTKDLIFKMLNASPWTKDIPLSLALINVKAIRAQTRAINKNSKSSDRLTIIWLILSVVIFITEIEPIKQFLINLF